MRRERGRRIEQHHQPARFLGRDEAGAQQADFADTGLRQQQLGERAAWPAAAGQLRVERFEPAGHSGVGVAGELVA